MHTAHSVTAHWRPINSTGMRLLTHEQLRSHWLVAMLHQSGTAGSHDTQGGWILFRLTSGMKLEVI